MAGLSLARYLVTEHVISIVVFHVPVRAQMGEREGRGGPTCREPTCDHEHMPTSARVLALLDDGHVCLKEIGQMLGVTLQRAQQIAAQPGSLRPGSSLGEVGLASRRGRDLGDQEILGTPWYPREAED